MIGKFFDRNGWQPQPILATLAWEFGLPLDPAPSFWSHGSR
ncbi:hypothetical protein LEP1GSC050_0808 [Leptospira broomii serovar Hurstbridge str. 5399]|uniref:Uncharacterized protein n=1 Tax=Leptospira broomii serovar Hurstbridge str. 5399 TaxID=1049789 RepID=T0F7N2_9LEPT|nr:hypothetical protein LEP1GSC050_0808 [Leptospira broomii serovar Hurstbridge str. 5399]